MQTFLILAALMGCLFAGIPVGLALTLMGAALYLFKGITLVGIPGEFLGSFNSFILLAVPIFLLTSNILLRAGVARDLFDAV